MLLVTGQSQQCGSGVEDAVYGSCVLAETTIGAGLAFEDVAEALWEEESVGGGGGGNWFTTTTTIVLLNMSRDSFGFVHHSYPCRVVHGRCHGAGPGQGVPERFRQVGQQLASPLVQYVLGTSSHDLWLVFVG